MTRHLAADIGGTKTLIHWFESDGKNIQTLMKKRFENANYSNIESILAEILSTDQALDSACLAIAGPITPLVKNQIANVTNLPWTIDRNAIQQTFNIKHCTLINDFKANGYAIAALTNNDWITLQEGKSRATATKAIIGAGTGLGQAIIPYSKNHQQVLSTEGGHVDFAPKNALEIQLFQYLNLQWSHVSYERILSGTGIWNLFQFLIEHHQLNPSDFRKISEHNDPAAKISMLAQQQTLTIASETMVLFSKIYGAQAGNLALNCLPYGGLYIAGGIAAKNQSLLRSKQFLDAFLAKGRMQSILKDIPVKLITNTELGLIGAEQYALQTGSLK